MVDRVRAVRDEVPGLELVYEPDELRFFQARFEPLDRFPDFGLSESPGRVPARAG